MDALNKYGELESPICPHCGDSIKLEWVACPSCGKRLSNNNRNHEQDNSYKVDCQICGMDVTILDGIPPKVVCPYISRFDFYGGSYAMRCKLQKSWGSWLNCGIFEGLK
jgi:uncharacterized protein YbaR (Trm112 family)